MKKIDSFFLSDKQIEQMKTKRKFNKKTALSAVLILVSIACGITYGAIPGLLQNYAIAQSIIDTIQTILGTISSTGSIVGVIALGKSLDRPCPELPENFREEIEEAAKGEDIAPRWR